MIPMLAAEGATTSFHLLPALVITPLLAAVILMLVPASRVAETKLVALLGTLITGAFSFYLLYKFQVADPGFQFVSDRPILADLGFSWLLAVDGISLFLVVLTGIIFPVAILACDPHHDHKAFYAWVLLLMSGSMGAFMALDLLLFFFFFEVVLVPMYFLIGGWGHGDRRRVAVKFFMFTMAGSALMLVGIFTVAVLSRSATGDLTFNVVELATANALSTNAARWVFASFALAFAIKVPLFPLHTWLPDAHTEAPTAGSVILAGVMLKLGTYGFIRFGLYLFPEASAYFAPVFLTLGVIGITYGAAAATMQRDLKRLVAYSSVAHLGFIVLGTFALNTQGIEGGILQMVNHGVSTGALFILVGWIYERRHTRQISALSGMQKAAPVMAGVFTLVMMSSLGLPGLNGFVGEFLILLGGFGGARWWTVVATTGVILAALYLLWAYQRTFHGEPAEADLEMEDLRWSEGLAIAPLLFLIVAMGVYPQPVLDRIEPAVDQLVAHIDAAGETVSEPPPDPGAGIDDVRHAAEEAEAAGGHGGDDHGDDDHDEDSDHSESDDHSGSGE